jgi:drug/metabolite transporter (DMT)-like permease
MLWLIISSVIWGLSFGLIKKVNLPVSPATLGLWRISWALILSGMWVGIMRRPIPFKFFRAGFIQLGAMYAPYLAAFKYLQGHEVALWTMTTPFYIALIHSIQTRIFHERLFAIAGLVILGGVSMSINPGKEYSLQWEGVLLVQLSNVLFALGQQALRIQKPEPIELVDGAFGFFAGAFVASFLWSVVSGNLQEAANGHFIGTSLEQMQFAAVVLLGVISTGVGFLLWNFGASRVSIASLTVMADLKLPIAIGLAILLFNETPRYVSVLAAIVFFGTAGYLSRKYLTMEQGT